MKTSSAEGNIPVFDKEYSNHTENNNRLLLRLYSVFSFI